MTPVPLDLPLRPPEAAELANIVFELAERKPLTDDVRNRIAARAAALKLESLTPRFGSLERDPVHHSTYYLAVDTAAGPPQLLHMAPAAAPASSVFYHPLLIGRMHRAKGPEIVINAVPFGPDDSENIDKLAALDRAFLPRAHGAGPALALDASPEAFEAFRDVWKRSRKNVASVTGPYHLAVWSAIRAGWREGYSAAGELRVEDAREALRRCPRYSRFLVDGPAADLERVNVWIRQARSAAKIQAPYELGVPPGALQALKAAGHPAQIVVGAPADAAIAREFQCSLWVDARRGPAEQLRGMAREMGGRFTCRADLSGLAEIGPLLFT